MNSHIQNPRSSHGESPGIESFGQIAASFVLISFPYYGKADLEFNLEKIPAVCCVHVTWRRFPTHCSKAMLWFKAGACSLILSRF